MKEIINFLEKNYAQAILLNCRPPKEITRGLQEFSECTVPFGGYANGVGEAGTCCGWNFETQLGSPIESYVNEVKNWKKLGAKIIGGCCGTTPEYVKLLA